MIKEKIIDVRCTDCGTLATGVKVNVQAITQYNCPDCGAELLEIAPDDTEDEIFVNVLLHDENITKMMNAGTKVHAIQKGDYCGDGRVAFMLLQWISDPEHFSHYRSVKLFEHFSYDIKEIGNFYRWYAGISINSEGKVINKSRSTQNFVVGQIANQFIPGAGAAISVLRFFGNDFSAEKEKYEDHGKIYINILDDIKTYIRTLDEEE